VRDADLEFLRALNADEVVMLNLTGRASTHQETDAEWARRHGERSDLERGLGYWTGWYEDAFVGWWGLGACSWDASTANLGYRLLPRYWGNGFATEGGATLLRHAFDVAQMDSVWASTSQQNFASQRVLAKLSMRYLGIQYQQCQYKITAEDFAGRRDLSQSLAGYRRIDAVPTTRTDAQAMGHQGSSSQ
jgi:RimJ/RimL family protein N-acetyltransferase